MEMSTPACIAEGAGCMHIKSIFRKIRNRFLTPTPLPPESQRQFAVLPFEGAAVSVEKALNSRCTSDYDGDTSLGHWGMFDATKKLSFDQIQNIISLAQIPRITGCQCKIRAEKNTLSFIVDPHARGKEWECLMIESGMQQQAVSLICAALGIGIIHKSIGPESKRLSETEFCTITMRLDPMKPSYNGSFWTTAVPEKECAWKKGNLPDPRRDGLVPLLSAFKDISLSKTASAKIFAPEDLSQILWAVKGRTPHFYKSIPWGTTIPTWNGTIEVTSVYVCNERGLFKYLNWEKNRPTHSIRKIIEPDEPLFHKLSADFQGSGTFLLLKNNSAAASLWEIGYSLIDALLQLGALKVSYTASIAAQQDLETHTTGISGRTPVILAM
jgi:hypothetical protein